ncbi:exodeoxyribonuclease V subunit alpha [Leucothrix arctica]|uniref:RecBCD enzyme subunit RecD n=1 Tax=Leucothrix arctica TaxID=1481894 RepID=A0A317CL36_9GAMM|nr:exodeoxyribonuclease V subunit alpha [Leucothrix arctica]PWQ98897.1 exodeoxyribonuclease V subunit alpha [Leucothrix arctica]
MDKIVTDNYSRLDHALADFLSARCDLGGEPKSQFRDIVLALSAAQSAGHSCLMMNDAQQTLLSTSNMVSSGEMNTPLVMDGARLYLQRYWQYESSLVADIKQRLTRPVTPPAQLDTLLEKYFPADAESTETDWQREAAAKVTTQAFSMITGGPGTGKTTTVLRILALLQEIHNGELSIALAAPTGKAAMRLQQSLMSGKLQLDLTEDLLDAIPEKVSTLHRLLGPINQSNHFRHNADKPLNCDLLVVDEASMIDLALMSKLLVALAPDARLILLGDQDQLASVESGAVLSDLCASLPEQTLQLKKTYRFSGPIKELATAVNQRSASLAWNILEDSSQDIVNLVSDDVISHMLSHYQGYIKQVKQSNDPEAAFEAFSSFQVLAALRKGKQGVEGLNLELEKRLQSRGIETYRTWYHGRPVMISRNDPSLGLFNGDIGLCLYDETIGQLRVWFEQSDGSLRAIMPGRLPEHETVYAMTIHKSQGSEFPHVMIVLPENINPLLSRELLYTAITRAKVRVDVATTKPVFMHTVNQQVQRNSGLQAKLSGVVS